MNGPVPPPGKKRFVIRQGNSYYLTTGTLLVYDMDAAIKSGNMKKIEGVNDMAKAFNEEYYKPATHYDSVDFTDVNFAGVNTGQEG